jgi:hypothetical protein
MGQLTVQERRRVFLARHQTSRAMLTRLSAPAAAPQPLQPSRRLSPIVKTAVIVALLSAGWFVCHAIELHVPVSIVEALPRL